MHTRIDETIAQVVDSACVGNLYVNRNIVGAVVGVQPFGGEGLSGTGPKAGGPLYLYRLLATRPQDAVAQTLAEGEQLPVPVDLDQARQAFAQWAEQKEPAIAALFARYRVQAQSYTSHLLSGPTGERNSYTLLPRACVLGLGEERLDLLAQLAASLAVGSRVLWLEQQQACLLYTSPSPRD